AVPAYDFHQEITVSVAHEINRVARFSFNELLIFIPSILRCQSISAPGIVRYQIVFVSSQDHVKVVASAFADLDLQDSRTLPGIAATLPFLLPPEAIHHPQGAASVPGCRRICAVDCVNSPVYAVLV